MNSLKALAPIKPIKEDYEAGKRNIVIYSYYDEIDNDNSAEYYYSELEAQHYQPKIPKISINRLNFQELIDLMPKDISLSDIKIMFEEDIESYYNSDNYPDSRCRGVYISFYYEKYVPAKLEQYEKDMLIYNEKLKEYDLNKKRALIRLEQQRIEARKREIELAEQRIRDTEDF